MQHQWRRDTHMKVRGRLFSGLVITAVGVIFLLNNLGIVEAGAIFRLWFWPLLLIGFGVMHLVRGSASR